MLLRVRGNLRIGPLLPCDGCRKRRLKRLASGKASGRKTLPNPFQYAEIIAGDRMGRGATQSILPLPCLDSRPFGGKTTWSRLPNIISAQGATPAKTGYSSW